MNRKANVKWPARITLWLIWPIVWVLLLGMLRSILDGIRSGFVQVAKHGVNAKAVSSTYGIISGLVMLGMIILLPAGFVFLAKITRKKQALSKS